MMQFRYIAEDAQGVRQEGELAADSADAARQQLVDRGLRVVELHPLGGDHQQPVPKLSQKESEEVVIAIAELSSSELPLVEGLRAAADESVSSRVAQALRQIAADVELGYALDSVMSERDKFLPAHVRGLVAAAARTHRMGVALDDLVEHHRATREVWGKVVGAIAYPLIVLAMTLFVLAFLPIFIVPQFKQMFLEFELELPTITQAVIGLSDAILWFGDGPGLWIAGTIGVVFLVLIALASLGVGTPMTHRFTTTMPLIGPIWQWSGTAAFTRLLATMLECDIPLPDALLMTRDGLSDPEVREVAVLFARGVENGRSLSDVMSDLNRLPASITPFVRWGERTGKLPEALRAVTDMLLLRVQMRTMLLRSIAPPVVFILVGILVGFIIISLFMPLISLIQGLS
ncbi:MAG: type II secretion system F family protein [Planctomycetaceae bacterium]|nr:type II secretion system F family protein [Planctomycetaceae bacterium]